MRSPLALAFDLVLLVPSGLAGLALVPFASRIQAWRTARRRALEDTVQADRALYAELVRRHECRCEEETQ